MRKVGIGVGLVAAVAIAASAWFYSTTTETVVPEPVERLAVTIDHGHMSKRNFTYTGEVDADSVPNGKGKAEYPKTKDCSACTFTGTFANGLPKNGELVFSTKAKYSGAFDAEGCYTEGELTDNEGYVFKGTFKKGEPFTGTWYTPSGDIDGVLKAGEELPSK